MTFPILRVFGLPYEQGWQHGRALRDAIDHNVALYFDRFAGEAGLSRDDVLTLADAYAPAIARFSPDYYAGMEGIAAGSGRPFTEIVAINVRYELLYPAITANMHQANGAGQARLADGCTAFAVPPSRSTDGHLLIGENWDWIPGVAGALVYVTPEDGPETLTFTEAGVFGGKIGFNSAGLGLCINGLYSQDDHASVDGLPFHVLCYHILRERSLEAARAAIWAAPRAVSANYLLAQAPATFVNVETAPSGCLELNGNGGCLVHANHFVDPPALNLDEPDPRPLSRRRHARLAELLGGPEPIAIGELQVWLGDHVGFPNAVCTHEDPADRPYDRVTTVASIILDLTAGEMHIAAGSPCTTPYGTVSLAALRRQPAHDT